MKIINFPFFSILLLFQTSLFSQQQQQVVADLYFDANNQRTKLIYGTSATHIIHGDVYQETVNNNVQGAIWLNELNAGQDGYAEFSFEKFNNGTADHVQIGLVDQQAPTTSKYILKLNNGLVDFFDGSSYVNIDTYVSGDVFKIERCVDKIFYYKNDVKYSQLSNVLPNAALSAKAEMISTGLDSNNDPPRLIMSFPKELPNDDFVQLKKKLDGTFFKSNRIKLRFTYVEKYAQEAGDIINCKIYDWAGNEKDNASYPTVYGVNWLVMPLPSNLNPDEFYTLEVNQPNKGETYYLRFKY